VIRHGAFGVHCWPAWGSGTLWFPELLGEFPLAPSLVIPKANSPASVPGNLKGPLLPYLCAPNISQGQLWEAGDLVKAA
jgi:hypothetical protein